MRIIIIILTSFLVLACTDETKEQTYTTRIRNQSISSIYVEGYDTPRNLVLDEVITQNNSSSDCVSLSETFLGLSCRVDSLIIKFDNNRGYISTVFGENNLSFQNKNPLFGNESFFNNLGNNIYEFIITQEDYENAHDLP